MYIFFYIIFLWLYKTGILALSPWNNKAKLWLQGRKNVLDTAKALCLNEKGPLLWMHCASIGEFEQGRPVVEKIKNSYPGIKVLITFYSPTGYELRKNYEGADYALYLPSDSEENAKSFIAAVRPTLVLWVKHEYWYFYLTELKSRNIPTLLISANFRQEQPFFHWYGKIYRSMLSCFTHIFVQTEKSSQLVGALVSKEKISVNGDTRFDRVIEIAEQRESMPSIERYCGLHPVIVAGSTSEEDEEEISHYANAHSEIRFLIAPCFIEEEQLKDAERLFKKSIRYSVLLQQIDNHTFNENSTPNVLLIDQMGILSALYRFAHVSYVGGGFSDNGVHNILEAAVYGRPVVMGPVIEKYVEALELVELGGAIVIDSALEAEAVFNSLFENPEEYHHRCEASRDYVYSKRGATDRIIQFIQENRLLTS